MFRTMKQSLIALLGLGFLATAPFARSQWLVHTTVNPGLDTQATFAGGTGAYAGYVTAHATIIADGLGNGVPGISPSAFTNVTTTGPNSFTSLFPLDPGGTFDSLNMGSNDSGDIFTVTIDFSNLANGYLPANSLIAFLDVDSLENVSRMRATDSAGNLISIPWLTPLAAPRDFIDYNNAGGNSISPSDAAAISYASGVYTFNGGATNPSSGMQSFFNTQDLKSLTFMYDHTQSIVPGGGGYGLAIAIPEPANLPLLLTGASLLLGLTWRSLTNKGRGFST